MRIVNQAVQSSPDNQNIQIPNYDDYKALMILIYGDGNNGMTIFIPAIMYDESFPFSLYSSDSENVIKDTGFSVCAQGQVSGGYIKFSHVNVSGWKNGTVVVYGIK